MASKKPIFLGFLKDLKTRVHLNKSPWKILKKRERERISGTAHFLRTPYYLRNG